MKRTFLFLALVVTTSVFAKNMYYTDKSHEDWVQKFLLTKRIHSKNTPFQKVQILQSPRFGKMFVLDGVLQSTEADGFIYHEMITHIPLLAHGNVKKVLILGGADGGVLREILRHPGVEEAVVVQIDEILLKTCRKYFSFQEENPKSKVVIANPTDYLKGSTETYDLIICDTQKDPLFLQSDFYASCQRLLGPKGVLIFPSGTPLIDEKTIQETKEKLLPLFKESHFYVASVPSCIGGSVAFACATNDATLFATNEESLRERLNLVRGKLRYYTPAIHKASFQFIK